MQINIEEITTIASVVIFVRSKTSAFGKNNDCPVISFKKAFAILNSLQIHLSKNGSKNYFLFICLVES